MQTYIRLLESKCARGGVHRLRSFRQGYRRAEPRDGRFDSMPSCSYCLELEYHQASESHPDGDISARRVVSHVSLLRRSVSITDFFIVYVLPLSFVSVKLLPRTSTIRHGVLWTYMFGPRWRAVSGLPLLVFPPCVRADLLFCSYILKAKMDQGPLVVHFFHQSSDAESSNNNRSGSDSQRVTKAQFNRLVDEPLSNCPSHGASKKDEEAWTSSDLAGGNELLSVDKTSRRPPVSKSFTTRKEG